MLIALRDTIGEDIERFGSDTDEASFERFPVIAFFETTLETLIDWIAGELGPACASVETSMV